MRRLPGLCSGWRRTCVTCPAGTNVNPFSGQSPRLQGPRFGPGCEVECASTCITVLSRSGAPYARFIYKINAVYLELIPALLSTAPERPRNAEDTLPTRHPKLTG
ncbi:hypothetical protein GCM10008959_40970 [Deinococcus seoulensis]|uniref:Uncharacterized protein n=1 Tax=Deinococcus seoulensis TaxID=1837379 RepID=A0ABQ2RZQ3_9DEIO|nr:hypothetical protein GCM10008959_40970 [Deinococcus seoulensis]